ncbi:MAG: glycoside hydrolase family 3 protein [Rheinheimera sp.]|nr:glycoside hydrolase family 3 protein [Rheinheimera sp.]
MQTRGFSRLALAGLLLLLLIGASGAWLWHQQLQQQQIRFWLGQKLMLDLRHFCTDEVTVEKPCQQPVTILPPLWQQKLRELQIGGVVLFAVNLQEARQISALTASLQQTATDGLPLLIATDQEGGRVARLPEAVLPAFPGAMALGATFAKHQTHFASAQGAAQAQTLRQLGININFSPSLDVNSDPANPVIGVRAFADDPQQVAALGIALARALQQGGVAATLKHFPGHGDTATDSHTGLPQVDHVRAVAETIDLEPFRQAVQAGAARLVMTAHIQYPALDDSQIQTQHGEWIAPPATLSNSILTGVLRQQLEFDGVVITDALNMQAISDAFTPLQAVTHSFNAGADIALMPLEIQSPADFARLQQLIDELVDAVQSGALDVQALEQSYLHIRDLKLWLAQQTQPAALSADESIALYQRQQQLDLDIAGNALTLLDGDLSAVAKAKAWYLLMPDADKCRRFSLALQNEFPAVPLQCFDLRSDKTLPQLEAGTVVIGAYVAPAQSAVEAGVLADLRRDAAFNAPLSVDQQLAKLQQQLAVARSQQATTVVVALRSPYQLPLFAGKADVRLATYGYPFSLQPDQEPGAVFVALARLFSGKTTATGALPVRLE